MMGAQHHLPIQQVLFVYGVIFSCIFPHSSANEEMWCNEIEPTVLAQMLIITLLTFTGALSRRKRERRANKQSTVPRVR